MNGSRQIGTVFGIPLRVHWTFGLLVAWIVFSALASGATLTAATVRLAFLLVLFGCVILHELGHALAAKRFGISTADITILPIGGVARLERMPRKPSQELIVALAGPAVNVAIVAGPAAILVPLKLFPSLESVSVGQMTFLQQVLAANLVLVVFNLIPAFPMDGGRVFRALLATRWSYERSTKIAARVGQVFAIGLALLGLVNPLLLLVAAFVFLTAAAEAKQVSLQERLRGKLVKEGMLQVFQAVSADASLNDLLPRLFASAQRDYPVLRDGAYQGMLCRDDLLTLPRRLPAMPISEIMRSDVPVLEADNDLADAWDTIRSAEHSMLPVMSDQELVGLFDRRQAWDLLQARALLDRQPVSGRELASQEY